MTSAALAVHAAIRARRSVGRMRPDPPPRETVERIVEAATWAPYHKCHEPWRFVVVAQSARERLGEIAARTLDVRAVPESARDAVREKERGKFLRAPVVVAVIAEGSESAVDAEENYASAAAATQNMLLAAHAEGLSGYWRTGRLARESGVLEALGVAAGERIVAFVYLGYPAIEPPPATRTPPAAKTRWLER